jgi:hypothetical protein
MYLMYIRQRSDCSACTQAMIDAQAHEINKLKLFVTVGYLLLLRARLLDVTIRQIDSFVCRQLTQKKGAALKGAKGQAEKQNIRQILVSADAKLASLLPDERSLVILPSTYECTEHDQSQNEEVGRRP